MTEERLLKARPLPGFTPVIPEGCGIVPVSEDTPYVIFPGFCDVHVHFREPGFSYKETIRTGCQAAVHGGFTAVCTMPNLFPVPDSVEALKKELDIIERDAIIPVFPFGSLTIGELGKVPSDIIAMAPYAIGFSDDGKGIQDDGLMRELMSMCASVGKVLAEHCEDEAIKKDGYINDGVYAKMRGHKGIPKESEWRHIERDIRLAEETGCSYHVCHASCKESVELVREAKKSGIDVSCETAPHYLVFDDSMLKEDGRYKMNPPIRGKADREALLEGVADGTVDFIATDHAPHSAEEKAKGLAGSAFGIVGLETSFAACYTHLVKTGIISLERLSDMMGRIPRERFKIQGDPGFTVWNLEDCYAVDPSRFASMGHATPFEGMQVWGSCAATCQGGRLVYRA